MRARRAIDFGFVPRELSGRDGATLTRRTSAGGEFEEITPYIAGDESRSIDMKRSIFETWDLYSRRMSESREYLLEIMIPVTASMRFGTLEWSVSETVIEAIQIMSEDLTKWGHRGEVILLVEDSFRVFPLGTPGALGAVMSELRRILPSVEKSFLLSPSELTRLSRHLRKSADTKVCSIGAEALSPELRETLRSRGLTLHAFILEHPWESFVQRGLIHRLWTTLQERISGTLDIPPTHIRGDLVSTTTIYHPCFLLTWLIQGFRLLRS